MTNNNEILEEEKGINVSLKEILEIIPHRYPFLLIDKVENLILGKVATGELTPKEGLDVMQQTTGSCIAGIIASAKSSAVGAAIGSVLGPIGTAVGGFIGGTVGYMAGSKIGQAIVKGYQKVRDTAIEVVKTVGKTVLSGIKSVAHGFASLLGF